jgi:hypothetical protein
MSSERQNFTLQSHKTSQNNLQLRSASQHLSTFRDPDINEQENGGIYNLENRYDDGQNNFFIQGQRKIDAFADTYFN